jgi:hypothetical protein
MTTPLDITHYTTKFECYPEDLVAFCTEQKINLPGIDSLKGQAIALMAQPEIRGQKYIDRDSTTPFFQQIGMKSTDSIQPFNKATGLKRMPGKGKYCLVYPFEADMTDIHKRQDCKIDGDKNTLIDIIKHYWRTNLTEVPNDQWQMGHLDPTVTDGPLAWQPPLQHAYRNRFKWDDMFQRMWPTADEWISKMDKYHTEAEQRKMLEALNKKFGPSPVVQ